MQQTYLARALISGGLWILMMGAVVFAKGNDQYWWVMFVPGALLAIILGKAILETMTRVSGLSFFFSGIGLYFFYGVLMAGSLVIAPLYCLWNLARYAIARKAASSVESHQP